MPHPYLFFKSFFVVVALLSVRRSGLRNSRRLRKSRHPKTGLLNSEGGLAVAAGHRVLLILTLKTHTKIVNKNLLEAII